MLSDALFETKLKTFLRRLDAVKWLSAAGAPATDVVVATSLSDGLFGHGPEPYPVCSTATHRLEDVAVVEISNVRLTEVFQRVSAHIGASVWDALGRYVEQSINNESGEDDAAAIDAIDQIKRDVCWAAIEYILDRHEFFSMLLEWYERGRFPCSWSGTVESGRLVVV
jgi:hypothetical protein